MKKTLLAVAISSLALSSAVTVQAQSFDELVDGSSIDVNFRYRVESADQDNGATKDTALANTLKSRITLKTGEVEGFSALIEGDNVLHITDDFNSSENNHTTYDLVKDPETTQLNQAYLQYAGFDSVIKAGNQRINLDNQRHVGGVGFRQDEATFDAVSVTNKSVDNTTIFVALSNNQNSITNANSENDVTLINVKYQVNPDLAATGFYYNIDNGTSDGDTTGVRAVGKAAGISYEAELARQSNSVTSDTPLYYHLSAGKKLGTVNAKVGYEVLGNDGALSFSTPLGTNHKFLGWSDAFLKGNTGSGNGIKDLYASAVTKVSGVKLVAQLHSYSDDKNGDDLGNEIGFVAAKKINNYGVSLKVAQYTATTESKAVGKVDTTKLWLTGTAKF